MFKSLQKKKKIVASIGNYYGNQERRVTTRGKRDERVKSSKEKEIMDQKKRKCEQIELLLVLHLFCTKIKR